MSADNEAKTHMMFIGWNEFKHRAIAETMAVRHSLRDTASELRYQVERLGYLALEPGAKPGKLVSNRSIMLNDACDRGIWDLANNPRWLFSVWMDREIPNRFWGTYTGDFLN